MGRPIRIVNVALGAVALLIAVAMVRAWIAPTASYSIPPPAKASQEAAATSFVRPARPPLSHFDVVIEKSLFKKPPPVPPPVARGAPPPAPPPPLPTLVGTILVDGERRAILSDKGKANIYSIGQDVAGGRLTDVSADRVVFTRGDQVSELTLKNPIKTPNASPSAQSPPAPPPATGPEAAPLMPPSPVPSPLPPPPLGAIEGTPAAPETPLSRVQRRRARLLMQQQQQGGDVSPPEGPPQ
jgi:hypothetical protein